MAKNLIKKKKQNTKKINILITLQAILSFIFTIAEIIAGIALLTVMEDNGITGKEVYMVMVSIVLVLFITYFLINKIFDWLIKKASE